MRDEICVVIDAAGQARRYDLNNDRYADKELLETISVPPHGDLIDRDDAEVIAYMEEDVGRDFADGILFAADWIRQQPTIIPASEEGE